MATGPGADMAVWAVQRPGPLSTGPLVRERREVPVPGPDEVLVRVTACGLCRTDLHLAEGDLSPRRPGVVPGHQVVGTVVGSGDSQERFDTGARIGGAWLHGTCGQCHWCRTSAENLCPRSTYTGWDTDGGLAEYATIPAAYAYRLPPGLSDPDVAPLLCGGIIGYRALARAQLPPGGRLGLYGFGSSAHITGQVARAQGAEIDVVTRPGAGTALARELGAAWVGGPDDRPPHPLDAAIIFAPAGELVPRALEALSPGGTLVLAGIHMTDVPSLDYQQHLFRERTITSVTSNTRTDGEALLRLAPRLRVRARVTAYPFAAVDAALRDLAAGRVAGSVVVTDFP